MRKLPCQKINSNSIHALNASRTRVLSVLDCSNGDDQASYVLNEFPQPCLRGHACSKSGRTGPRTNELKLASHKQLVPCFFFFFSFSFNLQLLTHYFCLSDSLVLSLFISLFVLQLSPELSGSLSCGFLFFFTPSFSFSLCHFFSLLAQTFFCFGSPTLLGPTSFFHHDQQLLPLFEAAFSLMLPYSVFSFSLSPKLFYILLHLSLSTFSSFPWSPLTLLVFYVFPSFFISFSFTSPWPLTLSSFDSPKFLSFSLSFSLVLLLSVCFLWISSSPLSPSVTRFLLSLRPSPSCSASPFFLLLSLALTLFFSA